MIKLLDCTLRDGGYYNNWDFSHKLIADYLQAMDALAVDFVEIGFRSVQNHGYQGGLAFSTDEFINSLPIPISLRKKIGVMVNGSELLSNDQTIEQALANLFTSKDKSPVTLVRIACHVNEFEKTLPAANWLHEQGYLVGFNLMQVADRSEDVITKLATIANKHPIETLYFADSMGSLSPDQTSNIISAIQKGWHGSVGIHAHDNMGQALANSVTAVKGGATWVDGTVTGMGRGAGNAKMEYLVIELDKHRKSPCNITKLLMMIRKHFQPLQKKYNWGSNPFYFLAGKYGIHPSYIQQMLADNRYDEEDMLAVIEHLKIEGGKKFNNDTLEAARHFYSGETRGSWQPKKYIQGRPVLILGTGPGVQRHTAAIESYIRHNRPYVIALNTQKNITESLIDIRAACHPVRLLADIQEHLTLPQPLATPSSMLPSDLQYELSSKVLLDYGLTISPTSFEFFDNHCAIPTSLVIAYALAIATSGHAKKILLAGFDGYSADDPRNNEMNDLFSLYASHEKSIKYFSITPTRYRIPTQSVYNLSGL